MWWAAQCVPPFEQLPNNPAGQYKNVFDCASKILREEGTSALLR